MAENVIPFTNINGLSANPLDALVIHTKLSPPISHIKVLDRPALLTRLGENNPAPLTLINAAAGFGKTTLTLGWLNHLSITKTWYSLDADDNDPHRFLVHLLVSLQRTMTKLAGSSLTNYLVSQSVNLQYFLTLLINQIGATNEPVILVLDDFQAIKNKEVSLIVETLIDRAPSNFHICIISRTIPELPLARYHVSNRINVIGEKELIFSEDEAKSFFHHVMKLPDITDRQVAQLTQKTEGWVAGMQLIAINLKGGGDIDHIIDSFTLKDQLIEDYFMEELLANIDEVKKMFLLYSSVFSRFNAELCRYLMPDIDVDEMLLRLERGGLFLVPLDQEKEWYRYHHLFSSLLKHKLIEKLPNTPAILYSKASEWFERQGLHDEAFQYACLAENYERAIKLFEQYFWSNVKKGRFADSYRWLKSIPEENFLASANRATLYAWCYYTSRGVFMDEWLKKAESMVDTLEPGEKRSDVMASIDLLHGFNACRKRDVRSSIQYTEKALEKFVYDNEARKNIALIILATCYQAVGDANKSIAFYKDTISHAIKYKILPSFFPTILGLSHVYLELADTKKAEDIIDLGFDTAKKYGWESLSNMAWLYLGLGEIYLQKLDLEASLDHFTQARELSQSEMRNMVRHYCSMRLSMIYQILNDATKTKIFYQEAISEPYNFPLTPIISDLYLVRFGSLVQQRNWIAAEQLAEPWFNQSKLDTDLLYRHELIATIHILCMKRQFQAALQLSDPLMSACKKQGLTTMLIKLMILNSVAYYGIGKNSQADRLLQNAFVYSNANQIGFPFLEFRELIEHLVKKLIARAKNTDVEILEIGQLLSNIYRDTSSELASDAPAKMNGIGMLSSKELKVVNFLMQGMTNSEISEKLCVSINTVKTHLRNIYEKLSVNNRTAAISKAIELKILEGAVEENS